MFGKMTLSTKLTAITMLLIAVTGLTIGGSTIMLLRGDQADTVIEHQNKSLRSAAAIVKKTLDGVSFGISKDGKVHDVVMDNIPEFTDHSMIDEIGAVTGETVTIFKWDDKTQDFWRKTTNIIKNDGKRAVGTPLGKKGRVYPIVTKGTTYNGEATILGKDYYTIYEPIFDSKKNIVGILYAGVLKSDIEALLQSIIQGIVIAFVIVTAFSIVVAFIWTRSLVRPVGVLSDVMTRISNNDMDVEIDYQDRLDEIGDMSKSVAVLKENSLERIRLAEDQEKHKDNLERQKAADREKLAQEFDQQFKSFVEDLGQSANGWQNTAENMASSAKGAITESENAYTISDEASHSVNAVASAVEELSASIRQVEGQVSDSSRIAQEAVSEAEATSQKMTGLVDAADRVGQVVGLISDIAEQTNLLALNATIEAARAGEAGKGFAVVAGEVKNLANQTAKATDEITSHINSMQAATTDAAEAITGISSTIEKINQISSAILEAAEEQGHATQEIAESASTASQRVNEVQKSIGSLSETASTTENTSAEVLGAAQDLNTQAGNLGSQVSSFVARLSEK